MKGHKGEDGVIVGSADLDARWSPSAFFEKALAKKRGQTSPKKKRGRGAKKVHPAPTLDDGVESKSMLSALADAFAEGEEDDDEEGGDGGDGGDGGGGDDGGFWGR